MKQCFRYEDVLVEWSTTELAFGNDVFRREIDLAAGFPRTTRLCGDGRDFAADGKSGIDFHFPGFSRPGVAAADYRHAGIAVETVPASWASGAAVRITLRTAERTEQIEYTSEYYLFPGLPGWSVRRSFVSPVSPNCYWSFRAGLRVGGNADRYPAAHLESCGESLKLASDLAPEKCVEFFGRTDYTDRLVAEHPWNGDRGCGNLLYCTAPDGRGLVLLQEAPPSEERRDLEEHDFRFENGEIFSCGSGIPPGEVEPERVFTGFRHTVLLFSDAAGRAAVLRDYLAHRFPMRPENFAVMVNPWGCGRFPQLADERFLLAEIAAAAECGAESYQLDDGWEKGSGLAALSQENRPLGPEFWRISDRFGGTFAPLAEAAKWAGIDLALWLAPNCNTAYRDHERFAAMILDFHRKYGFRMFKIDGVQARTYAAEANLEALLRAARTASGGDIYFNLDTTNGQRPGYFQFLEYGNIFLENRYVCHNWGLGYHPEKSLRNLWQLAHYVRPQSLQIEIPAPDDINRDFYPKAGLSQPDTYSLEYWAAVALFANPLLWAAPSTLSETTRQTLCRMMTLHRRHRDAIFAGRIFPVGAAPDGRSLTGFYADRGRLIVYREVGNTTGRGELAGEYGRLAPADWEPVAGVGRAEIRDGVLTAELPEPGSFALFRRAGGAE
jgi:hypothetical protein